MCCVVFVLVCPDLLFVGLVFVPVCVCFVFSRAPGEFRCGNALGFCMGFSGLECGDAVLPSVHDSFSLYSLLLAVAALGL